MTAAAALKDSLAPLRAALAMAEAAPLRAALGAALHPRARLHLCHPFGTLTGPEAPCRTSNAAT